MEETSGEHLGPLWELYGKQLGWFCESVGNHLGTHEAPREIQATQEAPGGPGLKCNALLG